MNGSDNNNAGAVAALENIKTPCSVAHLVMERTDHLMLVGKGALDYMLTMILEPQVQQVIGQRLERPFCLL